MNIYDIAKEAGVSISTVSKYLNNKNIKPELRERVEAVVKKYNFKPSALGRGLAIKSMKTIAVLVLDIRDPYYSDTAFEIDRVLSPKGYRVIICNTLGSAKSSTTYIDSLLNINVDGMVFVGSVFNFLNDYPEVLKKIGDTPVVCSNGKLNVKRCSEVYVDDFKGVYDMTKYVLSKTSGKIAYIKYFNTQSANRKTNGYLKAIEEDNKTPYVYCIDNINDGAIPTEAIIKDHADIKAIICGEDLVALSAINRLIKAGYKIGEDVLVTGYNASKYCDLSSVHITSVDNKVQEISNICAVTLEQMIDNKDYSTKVVLEPSISIKESA